MLVRPGFEPTTSFTVVGHSTTWANRSAENIHNAEDFVEVTEVSSCILEDFEAVFHPTAASVHLRQIYVSWSIVIENHSADFFSSPVWSRCKRGFLHGLQYLPGFLAFFWMINLKKLRSLYRIALHEIYRTLAKFSSLSIHMVTNPSTFWRRSLN